MSIKEVERELRANGFAFYKNARHGEIWRDNYGNTVMRGRDLHGRNLKNLLADISRAVAMRPPVKIFRDVDTETTSLVATIGERLKKFEREEKPAPKESTPKPEVQQAKPAAPALQKVEHMQTVTAPAATLANGKAVAMNEPVSKPRRRKFDWITRGKMVDRLKALHAAGLEPITITAQLRQEGFTMPDGSELLARWAWDTLHYLRIRGELALPSFVNAPPRPSAPPVAAIPLPLPQTLPTGSAKGEGPGLKSTVLSILTDPTMSDAKKIRVLTAMLED